MHIPDPGHNVRGGVSSSDARLAKMGKEWWSLISLSPKQNCFVSLLTPVCLKEEQGMVCLMSSG